jgi:hypothetical protein
VDAEEEFTRELTVFKGEVDTGIQALFAYLAIHATAHGKDRIQCKLNATPYFWQTVFSSLQSTQFILLGRVFDSDSKHNVHTLLQLAQTNLGIFSKEAFTRRRRKESANADEWLPEYLKHVYEPTQDDFRRLRKHVARRKNAYMGAYRDIRRKVYAHRELVSQPDLDALFSQTTISGLKGMVIFLSELHETLWELYHNGRKPVLRQQPHSLRRFMVGRSPRYMQGTLQERIVRDTQRLLTEMIHDKRDDNEVSDVK